MLARLEPMWVKLRDFYRHRWPLALVMMWLGYAAFVLMSNAARIRAFALGDTDDNLRIAQVRAWMHGQGWFDLVQHRFDPVHGGANIHWSRIVDLPIAGLILLFRPIFGGPAAERYAVAVAPLLPLLVLMVAIALTMRRLVSKDSWALPLVALLSAYPTMGMFSPLRIDHHGWQLALLAVAICGMIDPRRARGGVTLGIATGLSLAIGLEMLIYLALLGAGCVLVWIVDRDERRRLAAYAASLAATTGLGFAIFASYANRLAVCDALSPVWLSDAALGAALMLGLAMLKTDNWKVRLLAASAAAVAIASFHALAWPHCLSRLEGVSDEANRLWLSHVREARPFYRYDWKAATVAVGLPLSALIGWTVLLWRDWKAGAQARPHFMQTLAIALPSVAALGLLFWQMRAGPAAHMMAVVATAALIALFVKRMLDSPRVWVHFAAIPVIFLGLGILVPIIVQQLPDTKAKPAAAKAVAKADRRCPTLAAMHPVALQPKGIVFSFVDLGPRIIVVTHHDAIAGPYHRNYRAIVDVMNAFRGDADQAHRIITEYGSDYVLICPNMATATIFMSEAPKGFYAQLAAGKVPAWLTPIDLGKDSPLMMWKVVK